MLARGGGAGGGDGGDNLLNNLKWKIVSGFDDCSNVCRQVRRVYGRRYNGVVYGKLKKYKICGCVQNDPKVRGSVRPDMVLPLHNVLHVRYV